MPSGQGAPPGPPPRLSCPPRPSWAAGNGTITGFQCSAAHPLSWETCPTGLRPREAHFPRAVTALCVPGWWRLSRGPRLRWSRPWRIRAAPQAGPGPGQEPEPEPERGAATWGSRNSTRLTWATLHCHNFTSTSSHSSSSSNQPTGSSSPSSSEGQPALQTHGNHKTQSSSQILRGLTTQAPSAWH